jgi:hypothetical protein
MIESSFYYVAVFVSALYAATRLDCKHIKLARQLPYCQR